MGVSIVTTVTCDGTCGKTLPSDQPYQTIAVSGSTSKVWCGLKACWIAITGALQTEKGVK